MNWIHPIEGFRSSFRLEPSLKLEAAALPCAFYLARRYKIKPFAWLLMVGSIFGTILVELLNTGIEEIVRDSHPKRSIHFKRAMDASAAAVMVAIGLAVASTIYAISTGIPRDIQEMWPEAAEKALESLLAKRKALLDHPMPLGNNVILVARLRLRLALLKWREEKLIQRATEPRLMTVPSLTTVL